MSGNLPPGKPSAAGADAYLSEESAEVMARQYPLHVDGFEQAHDVLRRVVALFLLTIAVIYLIGEVNALVR